MHRPTDSLYDVILETRVARLERRIIAGTAAPAEIDLYVLGQIELAERMLHAAPTSPGSDPVGPHLDGILDPRD